MDAKVSVAINGEEIWRRNTLVSVMEEEGWNLHATGTMASSVYVGIGNLLSVATVAAGGLPLA